MAMQTQLQIRQNALEAQEYVKDLFEWQQSVKKKEQEKCKEPSEAQTSVPSVRGRTQSSVPDAPLHLQQPVNFAATKSISNGNQEVAKRTSEKNQNSNAATHTYDNWKKWEKFDVDAALASDEEGDFKASPAKSKTYNTQRTIAPAAAGPSISVPSPSKTPIKETENGRSNSSLGRDKNIPSNSNCTADEWRTRGNDLFKVSQYDSARECYTQSLNMEPSCLAYANRAMVQLKLNNQAAAEEDCTAALQLDPNYTKAFLRRGTARKQLNRLLDAASDFDSALRLEPNNKSIQIDRRTLLQQYMDEQKLKYSKTPSRVPITMKGSSVPEKRSTPLSTPAVENTEFESRNGSITELQQQEDPQSASKALKQAVSSTSSAIKDQTASAISNEVMSAKGETKLAAASVPSKSNYQQVPIASAMAKAAAILPAAAAASRLKPPKTSTEFEGGWRSLAGDVAQQAAYLAQIPPTQLPTIFKSSLTAPILTSIVTTLLWAAEGSDRGLEMHVIIEALGALATTPRFEITTMAIPSTSKVAMRQGWDKLEASLSGDSKMLDTLQSLRKRYRL